MVAAISDILAGMGTAIAFIWGLFEEVLTMISTNALMYVPIAASILFGTIMLVVRIIRKFGIKGKSR